MIIMIETEWYFKEYYAEVWHKLKSVFDEWLIYTTNIATNTMLIFKQTQTVQLN